MAGTTFFSKTLSAAGFYVGGAIYHEAIRPRSILDAFYTPNYLRNYYEVEQYDELIKALALIGVSALLTGGVGSLIGSILDKGVDTISDLICYLMPGQENTNEATM